MLTCGSKLLREPALGAPTSCRTGR
jgi:hypothetical protein